MRKNERIVIVGSGVFGTSTAWHLLKRGYEDVTVLERGSTTPAPDAASNDINRIVRWDYDDPVYASGARDAIKKFRKPEWQGVYRESGVLIVGERDHFFFKGSLDNVRQLKGEHTVVESQEELDALLSKRRQGASAAKLQMPKQPGLSAYLNHEGGWAAAGDATALMGEWVRDLGGVMRANSEVVDFGLDQGKVTSVVLKGGERVPCDTLVIATGSWTPSLLHASPINPLEGLITASGQCIIVIDLPQQVADRHRNDCVTFNVQTGFYTFPPNKDNKFKCVFHRPGYLNPAPETGVSVPRTLSTPGYEADLIPREDLLLLRAALKEVYPDLAQYPISKTRMCWYCDTVDSNFLIDHHPSFANVTFATGGSGHGFKFLPKLGDWVADRLEGKLSPELCAKWAWGQRASGFEGSRAKEERKDLLQADMIDARDLLPAFDAKL